MSDHNSKIQSLTQKIYKLELESKVRTESEIMLAHNLYKYHLLLETLIFSLSTEYSEDQLAQLKASVAKRSNELFSRLKDSDHFYEFDLENPPMLD